MGDISKTFYRSKKTLHVTVYLRQNNLKRLLKLSRGKQIHSSVLGHPAYNKHHCTWSRNSKTLSVISLSCLKNLNMGPAFPNRILKLPWLDHRINYLSLRSTSFLVLKQRRRVPDPQLKMIVKSLNCQQQQTTIAGTRAPSSKTYICVGTQTVITGRHVVKPSSYVQNDRVLKESSFSFTRRDVNYLLCADCWVVELSPFTANSCPHFCWWLRSLPLMPSLIAVDVLVVSSQRRNGIVCCRWPPSLIT